MGVRASKLGKALSSFGGTRRLRHKPLVTTPKGYVPVHVGLGDESKRFMIHTTSLGDSDFLELLCKSAEEYGFDNQGVLKIPYHAKCFEERMLTRDCNCKLRNMNMVRVITA